MATRFADKSFWLSSSPYAPTPALEGTLDVDVAVVGGGYTGLTTAFFTKQAAPELRVALLEAEVIGFGASGRNGGFAMTKVGMMPSVTAWRFGKRRAREAHEYGVRSERLVHDCVHDLGLACDYERPGFLWVATSDRYRRRLEKEIEFVQALGITGVELLDEHQLRERVRSPLYVGSAWWEPDSGILNPAKLAWSWKDRIVERGVDVHESTPVTGIERRDGRVVLTTPAGTVRAWKVVLATNAWSHLLPGLESKQVPVWTYIVLTEPLSDDQLEPIWSHRESVEDFRDLVHYYRLTADNRILFGGRDVTLSRGRDMDRDDDAIIYEKLRGDLKATFPSLSGVRFTHAWGGPVSATLDLFPALGYLGGRDIAYAIGCVGHGVAMCHLHGQTLRDLILERDTDLTGTFFVNRRVVPFPPEPLRHAVMDGIVGFMRWEDRRYDVLSP